MKASTNLVLHLFYLAFQIFQQQQQNNSNKTKLTDTWTFIWYVIKNDTNKKYDRKSYNSDCRTFLDIIS